MIKTAALYSIIFSFNLLFAQQITVQQSDIPPTLDGVITADEYNAVDSLSGFFQLEPFKDQPASERTVVYVTFSDETIFIGIKCYASSSGEIVHSIQARDQLISSDDAIFIIIDSYNDKRSAFGFGVNAINTQTDFRISDDGRSIDYNWDSEWKSFAAVTEIGWVAEMAIPFGSLAYNISINEWGLSLRRVIKKNTEVSYWPSAPTYEYQISKNGLLTGLEFPKVTSPLSITPYVTLRSENTEATENENKFLAEFGGDAKTKITSGIIGNLTINPDFATVEGDQETINLTRYELSFPEKRLFFMEGNELYSTRIQTFYSRRIGEIDVGAKVTGKIDDYTISLIGARSPEAGEMEQLATYYSAVRVKRDILESSSIGFTFADKSNKKNFARSFSLDYILNLGDTWKLTGQVVGSAPGKLSENIGWFLRFANESNTHHVHLRYTELGTNFRENVNQTGFVVDDDRREVDSDISYKWWFEKSIFNYIEAEAKNNMYWSRLGTLRGYNFVQEIQFYLKNKFSFSIAKQSQFRLFEKKFYNSSYNFEIGYNTEEWASVEVDYEFGKNFDADFKYIEAKLRFNPFDKMALEYSFEKLYFDPDIESESTIINVLSINYNFTPDLWIKLFTQNNTAIERIYFYGLIGWRFQPPFSALYLIYTFDEFNEFEITRKLNNRILFLKLSYQIDF
ncbi:DUF5916 domain-containing protein [Bacteroidota bacterium]